MIVVLALAACVPDAPVSPTPDPSTPVEPATPTEPPTQTTPPTEPPTTPEPGTTTTPPPRVIAMLHGGGSEDDRVFGAFVEAAGFGHIVTLGAVAPSDPYRDWWDGYFTSLGAASAETINTPTDGIADDPAAIAGLALADGVFIRGGDQAEYLIRWEGTALHQALRDAADRGAVIGGSSAGCAILGERAYDARIASVTPYEVLRDPYTPGITFTDGFLDLLPGVLTDTHFTERGRLGRLLVFAARWAEEGQPDPLAIGVDPSTALFVYDDGTARVLGDGSVSILDWRAVQQTLSPQTPPDLRDVRLWQVTDGYEVDLEDLDDPVLARPAYVAVAPAPAPLSGWSALELDGWRIADRGVGEWVLSNLDADPWLWFDGDLTLTPGQGLLPGATVVTGLYEDSDYFENHLGGMTWFLSQHPGAVAIGLDIGNDARTSGDATLTTDGGSWALVIDGRSAARVGYADDGGWQRAALEGATVHVVGPGLSWDGAVVP